MEKDTGRKIKILQSNNGGVYTSDLFLQLCQNEEIERHFIVREIPQQIRVTKRMNHTLLEKVSCLLSNAILAKSFWVEALTYASHLINRLPSYVIMGKTLMEVWSRKAAQDYDILRIFGCPACYHIKEDKLDPRGKKAVFLGFKRGATSCRIPRQEDYCEQRCHVR